VVMSPNPRELTVDAVVQIGSAYWLRIPIGKLHNDRYIPLHPHLKERLDDWIAHHRPTGLRSDRLLLERHRPITARRIATALHRSGADAGIGHVTAHQLRHALATQAIKRGMSVDAIAALLGHLTLAVTIVPGRQGGARAPGRDEGGPAAGGCRGRRGSLGDAAVQPGDAAVVSWVRGVEVRGAPAEAGMLGILSTYFRPRVSSMPTNRPTPVAMRRAVIGWLRAYSAMSWETCSIPPSR
jgi:Phage integrase family